MDCLNKILSSVTYLIHNFSVLIKNFLHLLSCKITTKQENLEIIMDINCLAFCDPLTF